MGERRKGGREGKAREGWREKNGWCWMSPKRLPSPSWRWTNCPDRIRSRTGNCGFLTSGQALCKNSETEYWERQRARVKSWAFASAHSSQCVVIYLCVYTCDVYLCGAGSMRPGTMFTTVSLTPSTGLEHIRHSLNMCTVHSSNNVESI